MEQSWGQYVPALVIVAAASGTRESCTDGAPKEAPLWYRLGVADHSDVEGDWIQPWSQKPSVN